MASTVVKNTVSNRNHAVKSGVLAAVETSSSSNCFWVGGWVGVAFGWVGGWVLLLAGWVGGCRCWVGGCRVGGYRRGPPLKATIWLPNTCATPQRVQ
jgi:hypothetical protein